MNPFPDLILSPTKAHRIPRTSDAEELIHKLLALEINAYAFLMDVDLLAEIEAKGFRNDPDQARSDLMKQSPQHIRDTVFPPPLESEPDDSDEEEGKDSTPLKGMGLKISMNDSLSTVPKSPLEHALPKKLRSLSKSFHPQQDPKKKRSGISLGM